MTYRISRTRTNFSGIHLPHRLQKAWMVLLTVFLVTGAAYTETHNLDPAHSTIGFQVQHMVITRVHGKFNTFEGVFHYDPENLEQSSMNITITAESIDTGNQDRDKHLRNEDFLDTPQHPQITFVSSGITKTDQGVDVTGTLTMHGVQKTITLPLELSDVITDPWGNERFGSSAKLVINRKDWGINFSSTLDTGGLVVGNEVHITFDAQWIRAKE